MQALAYAFSQDVLWLTTKTSLVVSYYSHKISTHYELIICNCSSILAKEETVKVMDEMKWRCVG